MRCVRFLVLALEWSSRLLSHLETIISSYHFVLYWFLCQTWWFWAHWTFDFWPSLSGYGEDMAVPFWRLSGFDLQDHSYPDLWTSPGYAWHSYSCDPGCRCQANPLARVPPWRVTSVASLPRYCSSQLGPHLDESASIQRSRAIPLSLYLPPTSWAIIIGLAFIQ